MGMRRIVLLLTSMALALLLAKRRSMLRRITIAPLVASLALLMGSLISSADAAEQGAAPVEGESFTKPSGTQVVLGDQYSGGKALKISSGQAVPTKQVTITETSNVLVRTRAGQTGGSPTLTIRVDGASAGTRRITSNVLSNYLYSGITLQPGTYKIGLKGGNLAKGRYVFVDVVKFPSVAPPPDTTPPEITVTGPEGTTMSMQATYTMSANEPVTWECTATFPVELPPDVVYEPCTGGSYTYFTEWDGTYVFTFTATDAAGNSTTVTKTLVRDTPQVEILNSPGNDYPVISGDSYSFQFETSGPVDQVQCRLWADARSPNPSLYEDWQDCTSPKTYTNLPDGAYRFDVAATAFATTDHGEWSMGDQATFTVDTMLLSGR